MLAENFTPKTSKTTKFRSRTKIFERTVQILPKSASQFDQPKTDELFREQETNPELTEISASRDDITVSRKLQERRSTVDVTKISSEVTEEGEDLEIEVKKETEQQPAVVGRSLSADNDDTLADEEVETLTTRFRKSVELDSNQLVSVRQELSWFFIYFKNEG